MTIKQNKPEPVVFDNWEDALVGMIRGRKFEYEGIEYHYQADEPKGFQWYQEENEGKPYQDGGFISNMNAVSKLLVGSELIEVNPTHIEVDTLLCVLDCPIVKGSTSITPQLNYFSHWSEGRLYCFAEGTTSLTATKTKGWRYWEFAKEAV